MKCYRRLFLLLSFAASTVLAGPGAHGPNGEHLDAPAGGQSQTLAGQAPRIETFTETFELVGSLQPEGLSILIDRYDTNEPVLDGTLEVELNGVKAAAVFHADHGDYAISDAALLKALAQPGKHALVFTLTSGKDSDLLEATLETGTRPAQRVHDPQGAQHAHEGLPANRLLLMAIVLGSALAVVMLLFFVRRRRAAAGVVK